MHEYASQGVVNETLGLQGFSAASVASVNRAKAEAEAEIARRGLVATVVGLYYGVAATDAKVAAIQRAEDEAASFLKLTGEREQAREAAHADVVKAQLQQQQQRSRDLQDAKLAAAKAKLELGVLLFADPRTQFETAMADAVELPDRATAEAEAAKNSAELTSALAALQASRAEVTSAWAGYLPDLALNFTYGLDAPQFAVNGAGWDAEFGVLGERDAGYPGCGIGWERRTR